MKRLILFLILSSSVATSQTDKKTVYLKNGEIKTGYITFKENGIKFKVDRKSKEKINYSPDEIVKIEIEKENGLIKTQIYKKIATSQFGEEKLVTIEIIGKVNLYTYINYYTNVSVNGGVSRGAETQYFVERGDSGMTKIYPVGILGNGSDKAIKKYFYGCPSLLQLKKKKAFRKLVGNRKGNKVYNRMVEIVKYYNSKCNNKE